MAFGINLLFVAVSAILLVPVLVFCTECIAAAFPRRRYKYDAGTPRPRVAVLIPAHNEKFGVAATIRSIQPQLNEGDRLVIVADNCTDDTAAVARAAGADVIQRNDTNRRGKGYALDYGLDYLSADAPDVVIFMDGDCILHEGSIESLSRQVNQTKRAAQAIYLLATPARANAKDAISSLAFLVKNLVRPRGLDRLGLPCLLTGAGMALPWQQARSMMLASGNIVEDLQLGIDLTLSGFAPRLCAGAFVTGELPGQRHAAIGQRRRWEHGYLATAMRCVPRLIGRGIKHMDGSMLAIAAELSVPPLALLVLLMTLATTVAAAATIIGLSRIVPIVLASALIAILGCVFIGWFRFGRHRVPAGALAGLPGYLVGKLPLYAGFAFKRETRWIRTARADEPDDVADASLSDERLPSIVLQGLRFNAITEHGCVMHVMGELEEGRGGVLVTPNLDHLRRCRTDHHFARLVSESQVVVADGMPLVWASRLQRTPLPHRVAGSDLISSISAEAAKQKRSLYLLGGDAGTAEKCAKVLLDRHPDLDIRGTHCPSIDFEYNPEALAEIIERLTTAKPDIIYVALGSPKQERLIHELREWLPHSWWVGVGYSFSFLCGEGKRAPMWMRKFGLEWTHRLLCEPKRLFKRYLVDGIPYAARLLGHAAWIGFTRTQLKALDLPAIPLKPNASAQHRIGATAERTPDQEQLAALMYSSFARGLAIENARPMNGASKSRPALRPLKRQGRLRAFVLLGGTLRPTPFIGSIKRSILDMPIQDGRRLLSDWQYQASELAKAEGLDSLQMRVMVDHHSPAPSAATASGPCEVSIERDQARFRGTGGILHDLAQSYEDDDFLLIANGAQILTHPLVDLVRELHETEADVSFIAHQDGTPSSVILLRCATLRNINKNGYVDLKEQAMPAIARNFRVTHIDHARPTCLPLRTTRDYLAALRWWHVHRSMSAQAGGDRTSEARPMEKWVNGSRLPSDGRSGSAVSSFAIVEHGATVDPSACLQDCVVLRGATVGAGAVVVRSVVCAGGGLGENDTAVDRLVTSRSASTSPRARQVYQVA